MGITETVQLRLQLLKFEITADDMAIIDFLIQKALNNINNFTNQNYAEETFPLPLYDIILAIGID